MISNLDLAKLYELTDRLRGGVYGAVLADQKLLPDEAYNYYIESLHTLKQINQAAKDINIKLEQEARNGNI